MSNTIRMIPPPLPARTPEDRQSALSKRLEEIRVRNEELGLEEKRLEKEIASVKEGLAINNKTRLPMMARVKIAAPCDAAWSEMKGDDRSRMCGKCEKQVHNLAAMTTIEIETFLEAHVKEGVAGACVRLYERRDGTIITDDCPVGVKRRRTRALLLSTLGAGACALFGFTAIAFTMSIFSTPPPPEKVFIRVQGPTVYVPAIPPPPPPPIVMPPIPSSYALLPTPPTGTSWVLIHASSDARIFEGKRLLGTGSLVITLPNGDHTLRAEGVLEDNNNNNSNKRWTDSVKVTLNGGKQDVTLSPSVACPSRRQSGLPRGRNSHDGARDGDEADAILKMGMAATENTL